MLATLQSSQAEFESPSALGLPHDYRQEEPLVSDREVPAVVLGHLAPIQRHDAADTSFQYHSVGRALGKRRGGCEAQPNHLAAVQRGEEWQRPRQRLADQPSL